MSHISRKLGQFDYFDIQLRHPSWPGKFVLDFGGNSGNILKTPLPRIDEEKYCCIDVSPDGIAEGKRTFPKANWILSDRYNISFNPAGSKSANIPPTPHLFDYILAYSVFTHIDVAEMDEITSELMTRLKPGGAFAFTFIDPFHISWPDEDPVTNLQWRLNRMKLESGGAALAPPADLADAEWFRLAGKDFYLADEPIPHPERYEGQAYHVFHTAEFMRRHFPTAEILPPANYEMQHCCVLRNDARSERTEISSLADAGLSGSRE